jgi:chromosome segregation ATPase
MFSTSQSAGRQASNSLPGMSTPPPRRGQSEPLVDGFHMHHASTFSQQQQHLHVLGQTTSKPQSTPSAAPTGMPLSAAAAAAAVTSTATVSSLQKEIQHYKSELTKAERKFDLNRRELENSQAKMKEMGETIASLQVGKAAALKAKHEGDTVNQRYKSMDVRLKDYQERIQAAERAKKDAEDETGRTRAEANEITAQLQSDLEAARTEARQLTQRLEEEYAAKLRSHEDAASSRDAAAVFRADAAAMKDALDKTKRELSEGKSALAECRGELDQMTGKLQHERDARRRSEDQLRVFHQDIAAMRERLTDLEAGKARAENRAYEQERRGDVEQERSAQLQAVVDKLRCDAAAAADDRSAMTERLETAKADLARARDQAAELEKDLTRRQDELDAARRAADDLQTRYHDLDHQSTDKHKKASQTVIDLKAAETQLTLKDQHITMLRGQLADVDRIKADAEKAIATAAADADARIAAAEQRVAAADAAAREAQQQLRDQRQASTVLDDELRRARLETDEYRSLLRAEQQRAEQALANAGSNADAVKGHITARHAAENLAADRQTRLAELDSRLAGLQDDHAATSAALEEAQSALDQVRAERDQAQQRLAETARTLETTTAALAKSSDALAALRHDHAATLEQLDDATRRRASTDAALVDAHAAQQASVASFVARMGDLGFELDALSTTQPNLDVCGGLLTVRVRALQYSETTAKDRAARLERELQETADALSRTHAKVSEAGADAAARIDAAAREVTDARRGEAAAKAALDARIDAATKREGDLTRELLAANNENVRLEDQLAALQERARRLDEELKRTKAAAEAHEHQVLGRVALDRDLREKRFEQLTAALTAATTEKKSLEETVQMLKDKIDAKRKQYEALNARCDEYKEKYTNEHRRAKQAHDLFHSSKHAAETSMATLKQHCRKANEDYVAVCDMYEELKRAIRARDTRVDDLVTSEHSVRMASFTLRAEEVRREIRKRDAARAKAEEAAAAAAAGDEAVGAPHLDADSGRPSNVLGGVLQPSNLHTNAGRKSEGRKSEGRKSVTFARLDRGDAEASHPAQAPPALKKNRGELQ